ncbi:hypothetical protein ACFQ2B_14950 [Streptomyces stramineus]
MGQRQGGAPDDDVDPLPVAGPAVRKAAAPSSAARVRASSCRGSEPSGSKAARPWKRRIWYRAVLGSIRVARWRSASGSASSATFSAVMRS